MSITIPPVRFSFLKLMAKSPAHYREAVDTDSGGTLGRYTKERGSGLHALVLGGPSVIAYDGPVRRGKAWEAFRDAQPADAIIMTATEHRKALAMRDSVRRNKRAMALLEGAHEKEIDWNWLGRECQSHLDVLGQGHIAELKTCESAQPERFRWKAMQYGYHAQLAFYRLAVAYARGDGQFRGIQTTPCYIVAIESTPPHPVQVFSLTEDLLRKGEMMCRAWMEQLLVCEETDNWPGYTDATTELDAPQDDPDIIFPDEPAEAHD